ncbi:GAF domain-containing protein [Actinoplanes teichomyceticus]|uniref:GAF domain-containing protein n=1 Tax=Actinoplanes teichomyceticus TaxID=1867 RepID=A0A561WN01_ACTTI|nr:GAF domain-containing protein [Actinoplanes teichomyceticus]TWG25240.1 GAF domain-containing protein [Actinoplanes teichomyceticus]GIF10309.1 histidine kinase [Actinoplanes teichomyceticus]
MNLSDYPQLRDRDRLRDVARLGLDRQEERAYLADVLDAVADRLSTPFAVVDALLDDAQVFLAGRGPIPDWIAEVGGTPMEWAFCVPLLRDRAPRAVGDLSSDPEHQDNPLVRVEGVRSYIGAPLLSSTGHVLGGLCALDVQPRDFGDADLEYLTRMAGEAVRRIEERAGPAS